MNLFYRKFGKGQPLLILHGLYGSSDNWFSIAKFLENNFTVYLIDLRNHGKSEHSDVHSYDFMSSDIEAFIKEQNLDNVFLMGHSMGGKVAIKLASKHPELISKLIVVDISPFTYENDVESLSIINSHIKILNSLSNIAIENHTSRDEIDKKLSESLSDLRLRQFLLKNLKRNSNNEFFWTFNFESIKNNIYEILLNSSIDNHSRIDTPTLFIKGEQSNYIPFDHFEKIKSTFTNSSVTVIKNSGHWIHAENPNDFIECVMEFLLS